MITQESIPRALERFDAVNARDPQLIEFDGGPRPREWVQAQRLDAWVHRVTPEPSVALRLAARCQHLGRYSVPRSDYPEGRVGYLKWRKDLSKFHADRASEILTELGFPEDIVQQVRHINLKQQLKTNPDAQAMEDALCLSFLEHDFVPFIERYEDDKVIDIVQKTWLKMSPRGHALALTLPLSGRALTLVSRALSPHPG